MEIKNPSTGMFLARVAYRSVLTLDRHGHVKFMRLYQHFALYARRHQLDRSKYAPRRDEGSPAWRRRLATQEYLK